MIFTIKPKALYGKSKEHLLLSSSLKGKITYLMSFKLKLQKSTRKRLAVIR